MNSLRFLLIESDPAAADRISSALTHANHSVIPASGFDEASEVLEVQKFDAVLLPCSRLDARLAEFASHLRRLERAQRNMARTSILSFAETEEYSGGLPTSGVDGVITGEPGSEQFVQAVTGLANSLRNQSPEKKQTGEVFDKRRFLDQVGGDRELALEILDLFLAEESNQLNEICCSLESADAERLMRAAHTIKGSFGSVGAENCRLRAQELETAAKQNDFAACGSLTLQLEDELASLKAELVRFRSE